RHAAGDDGDRVRAIARRPPASRLKPVIIRAQSRREAPVTTDYDPIAEQYKRSKHTPWRSHIECFTLMETLGNLEGLSVLNDACTREELGDMCTSVARCLKPGGRFVTVNSNPALDFTSAPSYRPYGFETSVAGEWREGAPITWTFFLEDGSSFSIENYYLS